MEMLVIAVVAVLAFAVVLVPLFRRGTRSPSDAREFDDGQPAPAAKKRAAGAGGSAAGPGAGKRAGGAKAPRKGAADVAGAAGAASRTARAEQAARDERGEPQERDSATPHAPLSPPEADPARGEGVVPPMAAGPATPVAPPGATAPDAPPEPTVPDAAARASRQPAPKDPLEREVARYREALRAGTICGRCGEANPPGSRFCGECGGGLDGSEDSSEFA
jgi:hypothetical protein